MFKSARWRSEKNKIKAVFKLQFHATQLKDLGGHALTISMIPADIGNPTKLEKAKVRNGSCYWEKPVYETIKFSHDPKTGKLHDKIYHFIVTMGSSKSGGVGEVSIDFASYAEATKISSLSLPLKNANCSAVLHVSIQRVQGAFDQREVDRSENASYRDQSLRAHFGDGDLERSIRSNPTEDHEPSSRSDITLSGSDSSSGLDTPREHEPKNTNPTHEPSTTNKRSSQWDWLNDSSPKLSTQNNSSIGEISEEGSSDVIIQKLKTEVAVLTLQADFSELELQTLRKQIVKEHKKKQDLSREVKIKVNGMLLIDEGDPWALLNELRQELNHEKDLRLQLQEKLESKSETDDDDEQRALEEIVRQHNGVKEAYLLEQKIIDLYGKIELYKRDKDDHEMQMDQIALDYEILKQENHDLCYKIERLQLQEQLKISYEHETQIESLENELKTKSKELSDSILSINELETCVKNLKEELENQARGFEADLEELTCVKIEQERRAIRAEDTLRKMRLQNNNAAERLQEELKRLSMKMMSTFEANEKAAMKAVQEANKLRVEKRVVKVKEDYEEKLVEISDQITLKLRQLEKMKKQIEDMISEHEREKHKLNKKMQNLEGERSKEIAFDSSENLFLEKEKDLQLEIEEFERRLDILVQKTENSKVSKAKNSNPVMKRNRRTMMGVQGI